MAETKLPARQTKFDADAKRRFLLFYEEFGLMGQGAAAAGVCYNTVMDHLEKDEQFAFDFSNSRQRYRDKIEAEVHRRAIEGVERLLTCGKGLIWGPSPTETEEIEVNGVRKVVPKQVPMTERVYSDQLLTLLARRHIDEYKDRGTLNHQVAGGVLLLPAGQTAEEWKAANNAQPLNKNVIDGKTGKVV